MAGLSTAVGQSVTIVARTEVTDFPANFAELADKWLSQFLILTKAVAVETGSVIATGIVQDQARLDKNLKVGQVRLKGCTFNVSLLSPDEAQQLYGMANTYSGSDTDDDGMDVTPGSSFDEFATSGEDDTIAPAKRPRTPVQKARKRAQKKRRRIRKRTLSASSLKDAAILPSLATSAPAATTTSAETQPDLEPTSGSAASTVSPPADAPVPAGDPTPDDVTPPGGPNKRRRRNRFVAVDFSKVEVVVSPRSPRDTFLLRPVDPSQLLRKENPLKLMKLLETHGTVIEVRDIRCGGLAVDFTPGTTNHVTLLATTTIGTTTVTVTRPIGPSTQSAGVISSVHPDLTEAELLENLDSDSPILTTKRLAKPGSTSWVVKLTFSTPTVPAEVRLLGRTHAVRPYTERPLQCFACSRYGHPARLCRSQPRCRTCGEAHLTSACQSQAPPRCCNCGGDHPADSGSCPNRAFQVKVMEVRKEQSLTFREARSTVTSAARSYAAALKRPTPAAPAAAPTPSTPNQSIQVLAEVMKTVLQHLAEAAASNDYSGIAAKVATAFTVFMVPSGP